MTKTEGDGVSIGKFDLLATYTFAHALLAGSSEQEAKERGMVAAIMGAQGRLGIRRKHDDHQAQKEAAERKKKTTITAASFDHQVSDKMGDFFTDVFLPTMKQLVHSGLSYDEVKKAVGIPTRWGAKISGTQFQTRAQAALREIGSA